MVHSHHLMPGGWKICQDLWDQTQQNRQGSTNITAVLYGCSKRPASHFEGQVILDTMRKKV